VEVIDHGVDGFLHKVGDTKSMAESTLSLLNDDNKMAEFRTRAAQKAEKEFNSELVVDHYENYYRQVMEGRG